MERAGVTEPRRVFSLTTAQPAITRRTFTQLARPWGPSTLDDQKMAGGIAWSFGEAPNLVVLIALFAQWARADEREQRRIDRADDRAEADGSDDELAAYNRMLAELARRDAAG